MKRVKSGCVLQTLVFFQRDEYGYSKEEQRAYNLEEIEKYKQELEGNGTRYQILSIDEQSDASFIVHVRKHLNANTDVSEYFG
ncbi:MAG: hypothetical protein IJ033_05490 [Clostridia bacterium]|nr:hypothetical protein [Clostridia bacterium]